MPAPIVLDAIVGGDRDDDEDDEEDEERVEVADASFASCLKRGTCATALPVLSMMEISDRGAAACVWGEEDPVNGAVAAVDAATEDDDDDDIEGEDPMSAARVLVMKDVFVAAALHNRSRTAKPAPGVHFTCESVHSATGFADASFTAAKSWFPESKDTSPAAADEEEEEEEEEDGAGTEWSRAGEEEEKEDDDDIKAGDMLDVRALAAGEYWNIEADTEADDDSGKEDGDDVDVDVDGARSWGNGTMEGNAAAMSGELGKVKV